MTGRIERDFSSATPTARGAPSISPGDRRKTAYAEAAAGEPGAPDGGAWMQVCAVLRQEMGENTFGSWLAPARLRLGTGGQPTVVTPTGLARDWLRRNAWRRIEDLWGQTDRERRTLALTCRADFEAETLERGVLQVEPEVKASVLASGGDGDEPATFSRATAGLQSRFTFETLVAGPSNEFAVSVAKRIASWRENFNPVLFHGPYGLGKTHILQAIAWEAQRIRPNSRVVYLTAEQFTSTFVRAVMDRTGPAFKGELRAADLLLVDDVHFIGGKKSSQEELFHTLISLMGEGKQVVLAADRAPSALDEVDSRLRSHLGSGLVCGIEPAARELRLAVLERKLQLLSRTLGVEGRARPEVLALLADRFPDNIRELEGGLNTLAVRAGDKLAALGVEDAETILRPHLQKGADRKVTVDEIQKAVADHYALKQADLLSERRTRAIARPRQVAMYLAKTLTVRSYPDIGRRFGGRDHTTVLHAVRQIEKLKAEDAALASDVEALARKLRG